MLNVDLVPVLILPIHEMVRQAAKKIDYIEHRTDISVLNINVGVHLTKTT